MFVYTCVLFHEKKHHRCSHIPQCEVRGKPHCCLSARSRTLQGSQDNTVERVWRANFLSELRDETPVGDLGTRLQIIASQQWRRQDLLRGGAKMEIMSGGAHGELQGRVQQLIVL